MSGWFEFVWPTGLDQYGYQFDPIFDYFAEPQVCGINGTKTGHQTGTVKLEAGSELGFRAISISSEPGPEKPHAWRQYSDLIYRYGPGQIYMSKAPGALEDYEGDGDWFKVAVSGASDGKSWDSYLQHDLNFTIPKSTPPGKYLVRVEHMFISSDYNNTQQYINCAQVEVTGPGGGTPGPITKFPGAYSLEDPGVWLPPALSEEQMKNWKGAGPVVWRG